MPDRIAALARRVQDDPFFLASALKDYADGEGLDDSGLAARLGCSVQTLDLLRLCRRPRPEPPWFRQDVDQIAARFGVSAGTLAQLVRYADALAALRHRPVAPQGTVMAARDRDEDTADDASSPGAEEQPP
jgi:hypothetical protein